MEENRRICWSDLFIKGILVLIFILFTVWLLSLSNKDLSNSLNVLTDNIFSENIEKMKNVGKEYFTIERLPKKIGEIETLTLEEMYEKKLILELKDKYGNSCDKNDSYVSIEKFDNEYQMKVNLECGSEEDHIIVIMGCYDYCDTDICELKDEVKQIEYEYKKSTNGYWTDYGKWSEWSKVAVTKTDYRQVETKKEKEKYTYDKVITETVYEKLDATCPEGYKKTSEGTKCYKETSKQETANPTCPTLSGYTYTGRNGFTCNYSKTVSKTADPVCPTVSGYTYTGRNGFTCNYSKTVKSSDYTLSYVSTKTGSSVPKDTDTYDYKQIDADYVYDCNNSCAFKWIYTYKVYKKVYGTTTEKITKNASCPTGYTNVSGTCTKTNNETTTKDAVCPTGYTKSGNSCSKTVSSLEYKDLIMVCPKDYSKTEDGLKCFKDVDSIVKIEGTKEVTYYRYRVREYKGGSVSYKWSTSKEDKKLLDAGYKLTGRTR